LKYNGDKLKRTLNSTNDPRVKFKPDEWQVKLLDVVDRNDSALVCCPTSSGKTFICYYAMEKILRSTNLNDMILFVSPNKALVNQVVAEIYTRFGDRKYPQGIHKTVYAACMPDYNNNDPYECQILVTVPQMLETLLCSKINSEWIKNIKYVIIDEIQTINDVELGASIEKIMHFIDCPLLGLSATISNFDEFYNWFNSIEKFKRKQILHKISHYERYCDLRRFLYIPKIDATEATESYVKQKQLMKLPIAKDDTIECLVFIYCYQTLSRVFI
jgi:superfamily II RNA helicase